MIAGVNLALRFLLELAGILAAGYWGLSVSPNTAVRVVLGVGAPLVLIVVWALVIAPGATNPIPQQARMALGTVLLELTAAALFAAGQPTIALVFATVVLLNGVLLFALG